MKAPVHDKAPIKRTLAQLLAMKETDPVEYWRQLKYFDKNYCGKWEK